MNVTKVLHTEVLADLDWQSDGPNTLRDVLMRSGVWLPRSVYWRWPVMLPWAVRDLASRPTGHAQGLDEWGAPNERGFFRDDNSMVKGVVRGLPIHGPIGSVYEGRALGTGFIAAHIWRLTKQGTVYTTRDPDLYSFVPNIVWLPKELAKRSDREGGVVQQTLQSLAEELYRGAPVATQHAARVHACWQRLTGDAPPEFKVTSVEANWFVELERFSKARSRSVDAVMTGIDEVFRYGAPRGKVISSRYTAGLSAVERGSLEVLRQRLSEISAASVSVVDSPAPMKS